MGDPIPLAQLGAGDRNAWLNVLLRRQRVIGDKQVKSIIPIVIFSLFLNGLAIGQDSPAESTVTDSSHLSKELTALAWMLGSWEFEVEGKRYLKGKLTIEARNEGNEIRTIYAEPIADRDMRLLLSIREKENVYHTERIFSEDGKLTLELSQNIYKKLKYRLVESSNSVWVFKGSEGRRIKISKTGASEMRRPLVDVYAPDATVVAIARKVAKKSKKPSNTPTEVK